MASSPILGCIYMFGGNFAPRNFMTCSGQLLPISQYTALFSILGTTYGGNGTSTFALPDLRGRTPVGEGTGPGLSPIDLGEQGGSQSETLTIQNLPGHNHTAVLTMNASADGRPSSDSPAGAVLDSAGGTFFASAPDGAKMNAGMATAQFGFAGGAQPVSILEPFLGITYIIAWQGLFPSRN